MPRSNSPRSQAYRAASLTLFALMGLSGGCQRDQPAVPTSTAGTTDATASAEAWLSLANNNGVLRYEGTVGDATTRAALLRTLESAYASANLQGALQVDANTTPAQWVDNLGAFVAAFHVPGAVVRFEGKRIELSGAVSDEDRVTLRQKAETLFPGYALTGLFEGAGDVGDDPSVAANTETLLRQLNGTRIEFEPESAVLAASSLDGLSRAARAIKRAAGKTRLEVTVHPEVSDQPEFDRKLAAQRAEALKIQLVIQGVSPGSIQTRIPSADVDRARAGKVEFLTVK